MAIKKLQNNRTTPEQSKRLLELGLPADSADLYSSLGFENLIWVRNTENELREDFFDALINGKSANIPIWSVGRLMEIIMLCHKQGILFFSSIRIYKTDILANTLIEHLIKYMQSDMDFSKLED